MVVCCGEILIYINGTVHSEIANISTKRTPIRVLLLQSCLHTVLWIGESTNRRSSIIFHFQVFYNSLKLRFQLKSMKLLWNVFLLGCSCYSGLGTPRTVVSRLSLLLRWGIYRVFEYRVDRSLYSNVNTAHNTLIRVWMWIIFLEHFSFLINRYLYLRVCVYMV